jgi:hypothetical protein
MKFKISLIKVIIPILVILCVVATVILIRTSKPHYQGVTHLSNDMEPTISKDETVYITNQVEILNAETLLSSSIPGIKNKLSSSAWWACLVRPYLSGRAEFISIKSYSKRTIWIAS